MLGLFYFPASVGFRFDTQPCELTFDIQLAINNQCEYKMKLDEVFAALEKSPFRRRFRLRGKELEYLRNKGMSTVLDHAAQFIEQRLAPTLPPNDGTQTPMRHHPVFIAQHGTATCCRGCLQKWHGIPKERALDVEEMPYVLEVLKTWLMREQH